MDFVGQIRVRQCCQSARQFNLPGCCDSTGLLISGSLCDQDGYPNFASWKFFGGQPVVTPLSWIDTVAEINAGRPFTFSRVDRVYSPNVEHMLVVRGWGIDGSDKWLEVLDPYGFRRPAQAYQIDYSDYAGNSQYANKLNFFGIIAPP